MSGHSTAGSASRLHDGVGVSPPWSQLIALVEKFAPLNVPVLITGPSGSGKEIIAHSIHNLSRRAAHAFVPLNCSALSDSLLESELFGHVKGAFTGAAGDKPGLCKAATDGTLFLDEVGELTPSCQAKLLRVLETGEYRPVGSTVLRRTNARIIAATNQDVVRMISEGTFRQDLYYRLNVLSLRVPPLSERPEDIPVLAGYFLRQIGAAGDKSMRLSNSALQRLQQYTWPGNVRELKNVIETSVALNEGGEISEATVAAVLAAAHPPVLGSDPPHGFGSVQPLADMQRDYVRWSLDQFDGNVSAAARALRISRTTLYRILKDDGN